MPTSTFFNLPDEKRQAFLECALDEFSENDFENASVSRIVARAGIAKGSLYQYFKDKQDLHRYLLELASQKKAELLAQAGVDASSHNLFDALRGYFEKMLQFEILFPRQAKIGYRAIYGKSPLPADLIASARKASLQFFAGLIEQGKQRGEVRPEVNSEIAAFILLAALNELGGFLSDQAGLKTEQIALDGNYPVQQFPVQQIYEQVIDILQNGLV